MYGFLYFFGPLEAEESLPTQHRHFIASCRWSGEYAGRKFLFLHIEQSHNNITIQPESCLWPPEEFMCNTHSPVLVSTYSWGKYMALQLLTLSVCCLLLRMWRTVTLAQSCFNTRPSSGKWEAALNREQLPLKFPTWNIKRWTTNISLFYCTLGTCMIYLEGLTLFLCNGVGENAVMCYK